jgi:hypothetical protein
MSTRRYEVTLEGVAPLLMHNDNIAWADAIKEFAKDPANKGKSVAGDDRTPGWTWIGYLYTAGGKVVIPSDNLMTVLREGGTQIPTGKKGKTFKAQTQSGIIVDQADWPLFIGGVDIPTAPIQKLSRENDFEKHVELATSLGFELFVKRAKIGQNKHVRVRPRFDNWACSGTITVLDDAISPDVIRTILNYAGTYCGLCDWRPSSKNPGSFGRFISHVKEVR